MSNATERWRVVLEDLCNEDDNDPRRWDWVELVGLDTVVREVQRLMPAQAEAGTQERDGNLGEVIDRRVQVYGDPIEGHERIAQAWSSILDCKVWPWQVPVMMIMLKAVRMRTSPDYSDHSDDIEGYLDIFRKVIGEDMIQARSVAEYIEQKWPADPAADLIGKQFAPLRTEDHPLFW